MLNFRNFSICFLFSIKLNASILKLCRWSNVNIIFAISPTREHLLDVCGLTKVDFLCVFVFKDAGWFLELPERGDIIAKRGWKFPQFFHLVSLKRPKQHEESESSFWRIVILAMGTWLLLQPSKFRRRMLDLVQPILLYSYFLWLVCTYCTQSVAQKLDLPDLIPIIGIKSSGDPTMACLILFAQAVICILLRAVRRQRQNGESLSRWFYNRVY